MKFKKKTFPASLAGNTANPLYLKIKFLHLSFSFKELGFSIFLRLAVRLLLSLEQRSGSGGRKMLSLKQEKQYLLGKGPSTSAGLYTT